MKEDDIREQGVRVQFTYLYKNVFYHQIIWKGKEFFGLKHIEILKSIFQHDTLSK